MHSIVYTHYFPLPLRALEGALFEEAGDFFFLLKVHCREVDEHLVARCLPGFHHCSFPRFAKLFTLGTAHV